MKIHLYSPAKTDSYTYPNGRMKESRGLRRREEVDTPAAVPHKSAHFLPESQIEVPQLGVGLVSLNM